MFRTESPGWPTVVDVSFDVYLQAFRGGDAADGDGQAAMAALAPHLSAHEANWAQVTTDDGGADVYGIDRPDASLMFNHISGTSVWQLIYDVAERAGCAVMPVGCPTCLPVSVAADDLPGELADNIVVVASGHDLRRAVHDQPSTAGGGIELSPAWSCPCCGYRLEFAPYEHWTGGLPADAVPPYENWLGAASYGVCESCGFEFGFDDHPGASAGETFAEYRQRWIDAGCPWWYTKKSPPPGWDPWRQLKNAPVV